MSVSVFRDTEISSISLIEVVIGGKYKNTNVCLDNFKVLDEGGTKFIEMCISHPLLNLSLLTLRESNLCLVSSSLSFSLSCPL